MRSMSSIFMAFAMGDSFKRRSMQMKSIFIRICSVGLTLEVVDEDEINFYWHLQCGAHLRGGR